MRDYEKTFIILARSKKLNGQCIAGRETSDANRWIRPVSERPSGELRPHEIRFESGYPSLGDIVTVQFKEKRNHTYQIENHTIDASYYWSFKGKAKWSILKGLTGDYSTLWTNKSSTRYGLYDKVCSDDVVLADGSLKLISVTDLVISVEVEWPEFGGNRKVRGEFTYHGITYILSLTDLIWEPYYASKADGEYRVGEAILCLSLAEPYKGDAYKLIAGVFLPST